MLARPDIQAPSGSQETLDIIADTTDFLEDSQGSGRQPKAEVP